LGKWSNGDVYLMKLNSVGDTIWTREFGGNDNDFGGKVTQTSDNGYIVTGYTNSFSSNFDVYVVKTDAMVFQTFQTMNYLMTLCCIQTQVMARFT